MTQISPTLDFPSPIDQSDSVTRQILAAAGASPAPSVSGWQQRPIVEQAVRVSRQIGAVLAIQEKGNKATHEPAGPGSWGWAGVKVATR